MKEQRAREDERLLDDCRQAWQSGGIESRELLRKIGYTSPESLVAIFRGAQACPRGLRHGFGVAALQSAVPLHLIQRWMGHTRLSTAIYLDVCGPEEIAFARRFWKAKASLPSDLIF